MPKYCPRCTYILSIDDTKCRVLRHGNNNGGVVVDKSFADEFLKEEMVEKQVSQDHLWMAVGNDPAKETKLYKQMI